MEVGWNRRQVMSFAHALVVQSSVRRRVVVSIVVVVIVIGRQSMPSVNDMSRLLGVEYVVFRSRARNTAAQDEDTVVVGGINCTRVDSRRWRGGGWAVRCARLQHAKPPVDCSEVFRGGRRGKARSERRGHPVDLER